MGLDKNFRLRGENVSRVEAFSDAVFGFAVTLVVVSLDVPANFAQLQNTLIHGFFSFAICFAMLVGVWHGHYRYFRRYGLQDAFTIFLNKVLLFVILIYIYPLKFLFNLLADTFFSPAGVNSAIQKQQWPGLMVIYGLGFVAVYTVFLLLYVHAYWDRVQLGLNEAEITMTVSSLFTTLLVVCVGLTSVLIAAPGGVQYVGWSGWAYFWLFPFNS
jgi:Endosomal/lysosomal potassium channel TMEM175